MLMSKDPLNGLFVISLANSFVSFFRVKYTCLVSRKSKDLGYGVLLSKFRC